MTAQFDADFSLSFPYALPGDVLFVRRGDERNGVVLYQRRHELPNPHIGHAAIVVSPLEAMEADNDKLAYTIKLANWAEDLHEDDQLLVLRKPESAGIRNLGQVIDAAVYWLDQEYSLADARRNAPISLARSSCSVLVAKILERSELLEPASWSKDKQIYPGELFKLLKEQGWKEVDSGDDYFSNHLGLPLYSPVNSHKLTYLLRSKVNQMHDNLSPIREIYWDHLIELVESKDIPFLLPIRVSTGFSSLSLIRCLLDDIVGEYQRAETLVELGAGTWKVQSSHAKNINDILENTESKVASFQRAILRFLGDMKIINKEIDPTNFTKAIINDPSNLTNISSNIESSINNYIKGELDFCMTVGMTADDFIDDIPVAFSGEQINTSDSKFSFANTAESELSLRYEDATEVCLRTAKAILAVKQIISILVDKKDLEKLRSKLHCHIMDFANCGSATSRL